MDDLLAPEFRGAQFQGEPNRHAHGARRFAFLISAVVLAVLSFGSTAHCDGLAAFEPAKDALPRFKLLDTTGAERSLSGLRGHTFVVHFFATWCEPCRKELPALNRLAARAGAHDITVVAVSVAEPATRVRRFLNDTQLTFPILLDEDRAVAKSWGVSTLPTTIILDAGFKPRLSVDHEFDWDRLDAGELLQNLTRKDGS